MNVWTCPNPKCQYDKELRSGQSCPLCAEQAKEFKLSEIDDLLKQKWEFKKSTTEVERHEKLLESLKFCPKCGSSNVSVSVFYRPSVWRCLDCGYEGAFIVEDSKLAEKLHERYSKDREEKQEHS